MEYYLHSAVGAKMTSTPTLSGYTLNSDVNANKTFSISGATLLDQDLKVNVASLTQPNGTNTDYVVWYRTAASVWAWKSSNMPFVYNVGNTSNIVQYDLNGTMTNGTVGSARWLNSYLLITNKNGAARHIIVPGRGNFTTLALAQAEAVTSFTWAGFDVDEAVVAYRLTWALLTGTYTSQGQCRLAANPQLINLSSVTNTSSGAGTDHNTLSNLQGGVGTEYYHLNSSEYTALSGLTASEIVGTDASGDLASLPVATYPSLTELSYVKGVTGGIQGQINAKGTGNVSKVATPVNNQIGVWTGDGTLEGDTGLTYDVTAGLSASTKITTPQMNAANSSFGLFGLSATGTSSGGTILVQGGAGGPTSGNGGNVSITGGDSVGASGLGGNVILIAGAGPSGSGTFYLRDSNSGIDAELNIDNLTTDKIFTFPNLTGTLALGTGTNNELPYWVNANTLGTLAVATYPSLAELAFVKGVTSGIQSQLNTKLTGVNTAKLTVGTAAPGSPSVNDLWYDIS